MADYKVVEDKQTGEVYLEEELEDEDDESDPFSFYYDMDEDDDTVWREMSYNRFSSTDRWNSEPADNELYVELEIV